MDTVNTVELVDESIYPDDDVLRSVLGESFPAYQALLQFFEGKELAPEWRYLMAIVCKVQRRNLTP